MSRCPDCKNEFVQPFVCTTCGAEKLYDATVVTVVTLQNQLAAAQDEIKRLRGKCAAIEGNEIGYPCVALSEAQAQRDKAMNDALELAAKVCDGYAEAGVTGAMVCAAAIRAMKECGK